MNSKESAIKLLKDFKGDDYLFGRGVLADVGSVAKKYGTKALVISNNTYMKETCQKVLDSLTGAGVQILGDSVVPEAAPNAPREDVYRLETYILQHQPDVVVTIGGGSAIDATKAAIALAVLGKECSSEIDPYFGVGQISAALEKTGQKMIPHIAIMTSASSGAHLTKYSNITDLIKGQKKLIVDESIIPSNPVFDYDVTKTMPLSLTIDGALDGIAHCLEVFYGANESNFDHLANIMETTLRLTLKYTPLCVKNPQDGEAREAIGLATDLGGYAIMIGGTNGAHLTSFSLVDVTSHGRACGIMNPYYAVFFAPAVEKQLYVVAKVLKEFSYISEDYTLLKGRDLGLCVAKGLVSFAKEIKIPTTLGELEGFSSEVHIERAISAAKDPQLKMKLQNMPVALVAEEVDEFMRPILEAAVDGKFDLIKDYKK